MTKPVQSTQAAQAAQQMVTIYPAGIKMRVTPDEPVAPWPEHVPIPSSIGVFEWVPDPANPTVFKPMVRVQSAMVRMRVGITEELGLGLSYSSLRRLMLGGFVRSIQLTPGQYAFDLQSYYQHVAKVAADPEFWTGQNLKRYMETINP